MNVQLDFTCLSCSQKSLKIVSILNAWMHSQILNFSIISSIPNNYLPNKMWPLVYINFRKLWILLQSLEFENFYIFISFHFYYSHVLLTYRFYDFLMRHDNRWHIFFSIQYMSCSVEHCRWSINIFWFNE